MRLVAIIHCFDDWYLLDHVYENILPLVDGVIIIGSEVSNYGEHSPIPERWQSKAVKYTPSLHRPMHAETHRRNFGLDIAKKSDFTHFIDLDSDEFYEPNQFEGAKKHLNDHSNLNGLVVESYVYFKSPTLTIGKDITLVPHIHKLTPTIKHEFNKQYPFAWSGKQIRIDPTRSLNINSGVEMFECPMHHMSWVRKDPEKKIRNSTARANLQRSTILQDYLNAKEGEMCHFYGKRLVRVPNRFGIPEYGGKFNDENL